MTKINIKNNKTKIATTVVASLFIGLIILSPMTVLPYVSAQTNVMPSTPKLSSDQQTKLINIAMNVSGIKKWSSSGWEYVHTDWIGTQNPAQWTTAVIKLHLPLGKGNPPIQCTSSNGSWATVAINLATYNIEEANFPQTGVKYDCDHVQNAAVQLSPTSGPLIQGLPGFIIAQENDVATTNIYGSQASIFTPSYNSNIFNGIDMDQSISVLLNQKWTTGDFTQLGWTITHVVGCPGTGINANTADLGQVDTSTTGGSTCIFKIAKFTYTPGTNMLAQTLCNGGSNYVEQVTYGGQVFQSTTGILCSTHQNTDQDNNSVFFENKNTVASSNWSGDVTGTVQSSNAREFFSDGSIHNWTTSNPHQVYCGSTKANTVLSGSLAGNGIAKWQNLSTTPVEC